MEHEPTIVFVLSFLLYFGPVRVINVTRAYHDGCPQLSAVLWLNEGE